MTFTIHPKAGAAALFSAFGVLVIAVLTQVGVHVEPTLSAAVSGFTGALGAFLTPSTLGQGNPPETSAEAGSGADTESRMP